MKFKSSISLTTYSSLWNRWAVSRWGNNTPLSQRGVVGQSFFATTWGFWRDESEHGFNESLGTYGCFKSDLRSFHRRPLSR